MAGSAIRAFRKAVERDEFRPLAPWEMAFAEWCAAYPGKNIRRALAVAKVIELTDGAVSNPTAIKRLMHYDVAFAKYRELASNDLIKAAREKLRHQALDYVDANYKALGWAMEDRNYRAIPAIVAPAWDRLMPKKEDTSAAAIVQVVLSDKRQNLLAAPEIEIETEVIEEEAKSG